MMLHLSPSYSSRNCRPVSRAFTLVEMLVVLGVMALLIGIIFPVLSTVRNQANRTVEMAAARSLMVAYTNYAAVNKDQVMPGYLEGMYVRDQTGHQVEGLTGARYPWRLAPFLDYNWLGLYKNIQAENFETFQYNDQETYRYLISLYPSLGLNTAFVGGDSRHSGFLTRPEGGGPYLYDITGMFYVRRTSEVSQPNRLMVFCSARGRDPFSTNDISIEEGYFYVLSPYWLPNEDLRWKESFALADEPSEYGFVAPRYQDEAVVALFDGHVDSFTENQLKDMRHWANGASKQDWRLGDP